MPDEPLEVITIEGVVEKSDGSNFTEAEANAFIAAFLEWCVARGCGFGGSIAPEWPDELTVGEEAGDGR